MNQTDSEYYSLISIYGTFFKLLEGSNNLMAATSEELTIWLRGLG